MKKKARLICWIVIVIALIAGIVYWQMYKLGEGLRTFPGEADLAYTELDQYRTSWRVT